MTDMENLKKLIGFGISVGEAVADAAHQPSTIAKITALLHLFEDAPALFDVDYSQLADEVKALTPEQLKELNTFVDEEFDIPDEEAEKFVELAVSIVIDIAGIVKKIMSIYILDDE